MRGTFDPANQLTYTILGGDLVFRIVTTNLRLEYLVRRQEFDTSDPTRFQYASSPNGNYFVKHGAYAEIEQPVSRGRRPHRAGRRARAHRQRRRRDPPGAPEPADGVLGAAQLGRCGTRSGTAFSVERGLRLKASTELWQFSDPDLSGARLAVGVHLAGVGTF